MLTRASSGVPITLSDAYKQRARDIGRRVGGSGGASPGRHAVSRSVVNDSARTPSGVLIKQSRGRVGWTGGARRVVRTGKSGGRELNPSTFGLESDTLPIELPPREIIRFGVEHCNEWCVVEQVGRWGIKTHFCGGGRPWPAGLG